MAVLKTNKDIKNEQDLQNLVVGVIFRMQKPYKPVDIMKLVYKYSKGANVPNKVILIKEKVNDTLDLLQDRDKIARKNGVCYPWNPITRRFIPEYYERMSY